LDLVPQIIHLGVYSIVMALHGFGYHRIPRAPVPLILGMPLAVDDGAHFFRESQPLIRDIEERSYGLGSTFQPCSRFREFRLVKVINFVRLAQRFINNCLGVIG
jgi:hypothetical protein